MKTARIAPLVEGDGEVAALPLLLRRIMLDIDPSSSPAIARPFRQPSGNLRRADGLEHAIGAIGVLHPGYAILLLLDSDDDCPRELGAELIHRASTARPDLRVSVVLACREYEAWFLAAAESLAGRRNLKPDLVSPPNPEDVRDAKGWLGKRMSGSRGYSPTRDQAALSQFLDLALAKDRSRSFRKLWKEIAAILQIT
jgi:hypothetical protein